jgi:hypothetical protein
MAEKKNIPRFLSTTIFLIILLSSSLFYIDNLFPQDAKDISVKAVSRASKSKVGIGEIFTYTTIIFSNHDIEIIIPSEDRIGPFEIRDSGIAGDKRRIQLWYELIIYETGKKIIPALSIGYRTAAGQHGQVKSSAVNIDVQSVFERSKIEADIRPIEGPVGLRFPYTFHISIGVLLFIVAFYLLYFFLKNRKLALEKRKRGPAGNLLAYRKLSDALSALRGKSQPGREDFIMLSERLRGYIGLNFRIAFKELTTEEFLGAVKEKQNFYLKYSEGLSFALRTRDMAKFANYNPRAEEHQRLFVLSEDIRNNVLPDQAEELI